MEGIRHMGEGCGCRMTCDGDTVEIDSDDDQDRDVMEPLGWRWSAKWHAWAFDLKGKT